MKNLVLFCCLVLLCTSCTHMSLPVGQLLPFLWLKITVILVISRDTIRLFLMERYAPPFLRTKWMSQWRISLESGSVCLFNRVIR